MALLESGSEGRAYLLKERVHDRAQLVAAIESVAAGGSVLDAKIIEPLVAAKVRVERSPLAALTAREREVLAEIAKGKSNAAIADTLVLTKRAVEKHINSIFLKLNLAYAKDVSKRVKATLLFLANADSIRDGSTGRAARSRARDRAATAAPIPARRSVSVLQANGARPLTLAASAISTSQPSSSSES